MDAKSALREAQAQLRPILRSLQALAEIKPTEPGSLEQAATAVRKLPDPEAYASAITGVCRELQAALDAEKSRFGAAVATYIEGCRERGVNLRESSRGWRVGPLEIALDPEKGRARFLYNEQPVGDWRAVADGSDLRAAEQDASTRLDVLAFSEKDLIDRVWRAYRASRWRIGEQTRVPIREFLIELRLETLRDQMANGRLEKGIRASDMPLFGLLYNLDRYRTLAAETEGPRVGLQAPSSLGTPLSASARMIRRISLG